MQLALLTQEPKDDAEDIAPDGADEFVVQPAPAEPSGEEPARPALDPAPGARPAARDGEVCPYPIDGVNILCVCIDAATTLPIKALSEVFRGGARAFRARGPADADDVMLRVLIEPRLEFSDAPSTSRRMR